MWVALHIERNEMRLSLFLKGKMIILLEILEKYTYSFSSKKC